MVKDMKSFRVKSKVIKNEKGRKRGEGGRRKWSKREG